MKDKNISILFIGNSHTYFNDMPHMVQCHAIDEGYDCRVTMIAHGGWYLSQHVKEPDVRFNILYGKYDYVVLQEVAHPFGPEERFAEAAATLNAWIREAGSTPVLYETWAAEAKPEDQVYMNEVHRRIAEEIGALVAPVGENWWAYKNRRPDLKMYAPDGEHASEYGSDFAAKYIWETIYNDWRQKEDDRDEQAMSDADIGPAFIHRYSITENRIWISDRSEFEPGITGGVPEEREWFCESQEEAKEEIRRLKTTIIPSDNGFLVTEYWMWEVTFDEDGNDVDASTMDLSDM